MALSASGSRWRSVFTGGEEDGVDNTGVDNSALYTQPEDVYDVHAASVLSAPLQYRCCVRECARCVQARKRQVAPELFAKHQAYTREKNRGRSRSHCMRLSCRSEEAPDVGLSISFPTVAPAQPRRRSGRGRDGVVKMNLILAYWTFMPIGLAHLLFQTRNMPTSRASGSVLRMEYCVHIMVSHIICFAGFRLEEEGLPHDPGRKSDGIDKPNKKVHRL